MQSQKSQQQKDLLYRMSKDPIEFMLSSLPPQTSLRCKLIRYVKGLNKLSQHFKIYAQYDGKYMMTAVKKLGVLTSYFAFGINQQNVDFSQLQYLGKLRGNGSKSQYILWDRGVRKQKAKSSQQSRTIMAKIIFSNDIKGSSDKNTMAVLIPYYSDKYKKTQRNDLKIGANSHYLTVPAPQETDFKGRASMKSVKNLILVDQKKTQKLLVGKFGQDQFHVDISSPMSPYAGFAIAVAICDLSL